MNTLKQPLDDVGLKTQQLGEHVLVSEFGGRILALMPDGQNNLLWINPSVFTEFEQLKASGEWPNLGGERLWISPEVDSNIGNPKEFWGSYRVPAEMDPADYSLVIQANNTAAFWSTDIDMPWLRSGENIQLKVERQIKIETEAPFPINETVHYAGYSLSSTLQIITAPSEARPSLWHIMQIPNGGVIDTKVFPGTKPISFIADAQWTRPNDECISTSTVSKECFKWSLTASETRCILLYTRQLENGNSSLLVRTFPVTTNRDYSDCPAHDFEQTGHMCQVFVGDEAMGNFSEMEFHAPALSQANSGPVNTNCQTHGFIGPEKEIQRIYNEFFRQ